MTGKETTPGIRLSRALSRLFDLMLLNLLWIVFTLLVITAGAATTALCSVMFKIAEKKEGYIVRDFFRAFSQKFRQSTAIWLLLAAAGVILGSNIFMTFGRPGILPKMCFAAAAFAVPFYIVELEFVFWIVGRFEGTVGDLMKKGILIPVSRLPYVLPILFLDGACLVLLFLNEKTMAAGAVIVVSIGISTLVFAKSFLVKKVIEPYENEDC